MLLTLSHAHSLLVSLAQSATVCNKRSSGMPCEPRRQLSKFGAALHPGYRWSCHRTHLDTWCDYSSAVICSALICNARPPAFLFFFFLFVGMFHNPPMVVCTDVHKHLVRAPQLLDFSICGVDRYYVDANHMQTCV